MDKRIKASAYGENNEHDRCNAKCEAAESKPALKNACVTDFIFCQEKITDAMISRCCSLTELYQGRTFPVGPWQLCCGKVSMSHAISFAYRGPSRHLFLTIHVGTTGIICGRGK